MLIVVSKPEDFKHIYRQGYQRLTGWKDSLFSLFIKYHIMNELIHVTKEEQKIKGIEAITGYIEMAKRIEEEAKKIKVTDDNSEVVADNIAKKAKKLKKQLNDKKLDMTEEWREKTRMVNDLANRIMDPIDNAAKIAGNNVTQYRLMKEREREKKLQEAREKQQQLDKLVSVIGELFNTFRDVVVEINDEDELSELSKKWVSLKNPDSKINKLISLSRELAPEYEQQLLSIREDMMTLGKARRQEIQTGKKLKSEEIANHIAEKQKAEQLTKENTSLAQTSAELKTLEEKKTKGLKKIWKFELEDLECVPLEFLQVNEKALKEYMSNHKEELEKQPVSGIRFFQDAVHVS